MSAVPIQAPDPKPQAQTTQTAPAATKEYDPLDPYQGHYITTANPRYAGDLFGVQFRNGSARAEALPKDADEETVAERKAALEYFQNAAPYVKRMQTEDPDTGRLVTLPPKIHQAYTVRPITSGPARLRSVQSDD